jgi:hypothetical protein
MSTKLSMVVCTESHDALVTLDRSAPDLAVPANGIVVAFLKPAPYRRQCVTLEEFERLATDFLLSSAAVAVPKLSPEQAEDILTKKLAYIAALFALASVVKSPRLLDMPELGEEIYERNV